MISPALWKAIGYTPHEKQMEYHQSNARFKVASCGRRFGKTHMAIRDYEPLSLDPDKPTRGWIVGPTYKLGEKEFRVLWDDVVVKLKLGGKIKRKAYNLRTGEMYIEFPWGSRVDVMTADQPDSLVGEGLDWVIMSEAAKQPPHIFEKYIRPALADHKGKCAFPSTPEGFNWFYDMYIKGQGDDPEWQSWRYPAWLNPYVYPGGWDDPEIQSQLRTPDDPWFWQEIGADFRSVVGLIYSEFKHESHVRKWTYDPRLPNYTWFDFGYTNPFVCLDVQITPSDEIHIWREYYVSGLSPYRHGLALLERDNPPEYHIDGAFGDSADPATINTLSDIGLPWIVAYDEAKDWLRGVQEVKRFLLDSDGISHLFVDPSCENTIREFGTYKVKEQRTIRDPRQNKLEAPEKRDDHAMDAIRYGIMHHFVLGADTHLDEYPTYSEEGSRGIFTWGDEPIVTFGEGVTL